MRLSLVFLLTFWFSLLADGSFAQKIDSSKKVQVKLVALKKDSSRVDIRRIDENAIAKYNKQKEFNYEETTPADTWWDKFWRAFWRFIQRLFSTDSESSRINPAFMSILKYFFIALAVAILVFVVFKITGLDLKLLTGKSKAVEVPYEESLENIHEINFDEQLENALSNGNYRLAVRLLYLKTLKNLSDKQFIIWQPEKTNQIYVSEIHDEHLQQEFAKLTYQFEYIWYGEFFIDQNSYDPIRSSFQQFNQEAI